MTMLVRLCLKLSLIFSFQALGIAQQITIPRIELMPNQPSPYEMRNWKQVAAGFDSLVFDLTRTGQYLPLIWKTSNTVNYPEHGSFGIETIVGSPRQQFSEAITVLPSVISASLVGIDKSAQNNENWVLQCEEYFNRRPEENIYLNHSVAQSGEDWWYETMPNIFFFQLNALYPHTGHFDEQLETIAGQWLSAVKAMGGSDTPWDVPAMNYRAWSFPTMRPLNSGVPEPEAAGAIAWILYHSFKQTGNENYLKSAEWALEFLNSRVSNPSYELQLPYGVYIAAKMNAELGTEYNIAKMVNWCFDVGPLRSWGAIVGTWGGYDVSGLIGEVSTNDYAFLMNGFERVGALVPMTRYDDRFSRATAKWVLNLANASRLFYPNYLPPQNQDNEEWSFVHDPASYIGHEAIRKNQYNQSPYATGDAVSGGWGYTNLALYGSAHVGILGGIIDTTNVPMILKLDLLKTDFYREKAYPTFLLFNPYSQTKAVQVDVGSEPKDLYDVVSNTFLARAVAGSTAVSIAPNEVIQLVLAPAGGSVSFELNKMLIDSIYVDYNAGQTVENFPPRIKSLAASQKSIFIGQTTTLFCTAEDRDDLELTYNWKATGGQITGESDVIDWQAPDTAGVYTIRCTAFDDGGEADTRTVSVTVINNHLPVIDKIVAEPAIIDVNGSTILTCFAHDEDGDSLSYSWYDQQDELFAMGAQLNWQAPSLPGFYKMKCLVEDEDGGQVEDSVFVTVGRQAAFFPFNGNAQDDGPFENNGTVKGAVPAADRFGNTASAFYFDGEDDAVQVANHPTLNFQHEVSINFWMNMPQYLPRESFPISHGSWQNRWKVSIIPTKKMRWTINTESGIADLDSKNTLFPDSTYNVHVSYDMSIMKMYLNGELSSSKSWTGQLKQTTLDLTIGQMLPGNNQYNFEGILDDLHIYNRVLTDEEIRDLFDALPTTAQTSPEITLPKQNQLYTNYPNPFNPHTIIRYDLRQAAHVQLQIYNVLGQHVRTLVNQRHVPGTKQVMWDGRDETGIHAPSGIYIYKLKVNSFVEIRKMLLLK